MKIQLSKYLLVSSIGFVGLGITCSAVQAETYSADAEHLNSYASETHADTGHHGAHHVVGLFVGGTTTDETTEFSIGGEYEYHFNQYFGVGVIAEHTIESPHFTDGSTIALAAFYAHPWKGLRLTTAVGAEVGHGDVAHHGGGVTTHAKADDHAVPVDDGHGVDIAPDLHSIDTEEAGSEVLVRLGIAYDFKVTPEMAIAPAVNVDFVDGEENVVYGMVFSYHF